MYVSDTNIELLTACYLQDIQTPVIAAMANDSHVAIINSCIALLVLVKVLIMGRHFS